MNKQESATVRIADPRLAAVPATGSIQLELANAVVGANKELFGRGPTKARVIIQGNLVVCVLAECLTKAERTLIQNGREEAVALLRHEMHSVACPRLTRIVEDLTGHRVSACTSGIDLAAGEQVVTFSLDRPVGDDPRA